MKLKLSERKHLPVLVLENEGKYAFPLWRYRWVKKIEASGLQLDSTGIAALGETRKDRYLPPFSLVGKTVLDLGACCGETAWYFLRHGATKVICVECDSLRVKMLEANKKNLGLNIEIVPERFRLEHLMLSYDFIKCDVQGAETILLDYIDWFGDLLPCVVEVHGSEVMKQFAERDFKTVSKSEKEYRGIDGFYIMTNYGECK